jgi:DNA-binding GntR family transcriptional regulator
LSLHTERTNSTEAQVQPLIAYAALYLDRDEAMARAHQSKAYTRRQIADYFGVSIKTVSRAIQSFAPVGG